MVRDMTTGETWTPDTDFIRDMYNLGRYVDETQAERLKSNMSQGEREMEFNRWLARLLTEAFFIGAEAMADQVEEDHRIKTQPMFAFETIEHPDGIEYRTWKDSHV